MKKKLSALILLMALIAISGNNYICGQPVTKIISPEEYYGFRPGNDRTLLSYSDLTDYLQLLAGSSEMVKMIPIGESSMGKTIYIVFVSSQNNIDQLDELKEINRRLALDPGIPDQERADMITKGRVFVMSSHSLHSSEVGPAVSVPLIVYDIITSSDPGVKKILEDVVFMIIPNPNPDGMDLVYNNYQKHLGTKYEGAALPEVYNKYNGHDNNRDFVILSQKETRVLSRITSHDWFPQVYIDKHQMGTTGIRYFVPPLHDPIAEIVDAELWSWTGIFGANMLKDMTNAGEAGVGTHTIFDLYWPGASLTSIWKNVIGMLTEAASVKGATPLYIEQTELSVGGKGLSEYKKGVNLPLPWEGGWWHLSDIVSYEQTSMMSVLRTAGLNKDRILEFRNDLCRKEVNKGKTLPPFYYVLPVEQRDKSEFVDLVNLLLEHGINVYELQNEYMLADNFLSAGDIVVPLSQAFRPFIIEVMEVQDYPVRHYTPGGDVIKPYDITSWSLPLHRQVKCFAINEIDRDFENLLKPVGEKYSLILTPVAANKTLVFSPTSNGSYRAAFMALKSGIKVKRTGKEAIINSNVVPAGSFVIDPGPGDIKKIEAIINRIGFSPAVFDSDRGLDPVSIEMPKIALIESVSNIDAGWTRFVMDDYSIPFSVLKPADIASANLEKEYDIIVIPSTSKIMLMTGKSRDDGRYALASLHPDEIKGMGTDGLNKLIEFINRGGRVVAWGNATELFEGKLKAGDEEFYFPFTIDRSPYGQGLNIPGSMLEINITGEGPLCYGMPDKTGLYFNNSHVFKTSVPGFDVDRRVLAKFPEKNILLSGYAENENLLANKPAIIWLKKGKGQLVLMGFNPQFRASTQSTYKLLFNAILLNDN